MTETAVEVKDATAEKDTKEENNMKEQTTETGATGEDSNKTVENQTAEQPAAPAPPKGCRNPNFIRDLVYLFQYSRTPTIASVSPFCLKVESWVRLAGIKYENVDHKLKYKSKKGQLPFIELNGEEISDSTNIIQYLGEKFEKNLDAGLTNEQKNVSHAICSMIENHLLWVVNWWKAKYPDDMIKGYKLNLQNFVGTRVPVGILNFIFKMKYSRGALKKLRAHGIGIHSPEEIEKFGENDLKVLSDMLGDKPFFFGDEPTNLDVIAFANIAQIYFVDKEVEYKLRDHLTENLPNLVGHVNRMKERCFPDWDDICKTLDMNAHLPKPVPEKKESDNDEKKIEKEETATDEKIENDKPAVENKDKN